MINFDEDLEELKAERIIKAKGRLTCIAHNQVNTLGKRLNSERL